MEFDHLIVTQGTLRTEVNAADVIIRVRGKDGLKARQYFGQTKRIFTPTGSKDTQILTVVVGHLLTLDYCPDEYFIVAEIEAFLARSHQK